MHGQKGNLLRAGLMQALAGGVAFTIAFTAVSVWAQSVSGLSGGPGQTSLASANEGVPITGIEVEFEGTGAPGDRLDDIRRSVLRMPGLRIGDGWNQLLADSAMAKLTTLRNVHTAQYRLVRHVNTDGVEVIVRITLEVEREKKPATGVLATGTLAAFPILYQDERSMFRILLNGGFGVFTDGNPWFDSPKTFTTGNPLVQKPEIGADTGARATWTEGYAEHGLAGITQIGHAALYGYGAATMISPFALGRDIFRDDARFTTDVEKLYAGFLYAPEGSDLRVNVSVGRQNFELNEGFLVAQYGSQSNAGPRPGLYLAPRTTWRYFRRSR